MLFCLALALLPACGGGQEPAASADRPRLVVLVGVDQLASWVFEAGRPHLQPDGGFARLMQQGSWFRECAYLHGCTETGPGHATIGTGAPARMHGIVRNAWYDAAAKRAVYCAEDLTAKTFAEFPEAADRGPALLQAPTLAQHLKTNLGDACRVVSVSAKDRSAILMAGPYADAVVWFSTATGRFVTNRNWGDEVPAWLLDLDRRRPANRYLGFEWDRIGPADAYADCVDDRTFEQPHASSGGRTLPVAIRGGGEAPSPTFWSEIYDSPVMNELVWLAAEAGLRGEQLGRDDDPDLLCVSFSANDTVGHRFGPGSVEARDCLLRLDRLLAKMLDTLDETVGRGRYAVLLTADHGVAPAPEAAQAAGKDAGRGLFHMRGRAAADAALRRQFSAEGRFVLEAREQSLYLDHDAVYRAAGATDDASRAAALQQARRTASDALLAVPGIMAAFSAEELLAPSGPPADPVAAAMWYASVPGRAGDVVMAFKPYWVESTLTATHGSPHPYDQRVPLIAMGAGIRAAYESEASVSPGLAAVLAAKLLGLPPLAATLDSVPVDAMGQ